MLAELQHVPAGVLGGGVLRPGDPGDVGQPGQDRVAELEGQRVRRGGGDLAQALLAGLVPGADQAAQRPLRLGRPDGGRVGLGGVLEVADQVRQARLVPGDVLPSGVEVVLVPVRDLHAGEARQDPELAHGLQGPLPHEERRVLLGEGPVHVLLLPGGPGPQGGLIEPGHVRGGDQRLDQRDHPGGQVGGRAQAGVDEPGRDPRAGDVSDQLLAPLDRHVLEHDQFSGGPRPAA